MCLPKRRLFSKSTPDRITVRQSDNAHSFPLTMVRIKHRYLLINILYPDNKDPVALRSADETLENCYTIQFRRPSDDRVDARLLLRVVRDCVADLFGDYGSGKVASSLQGTVEQPAIVRSKP